MTFEEWWDKTIGQYLKDEHEFKAARQSITYKAMKRAYEAGIESVSSKWQTIETAPKDGRKILCYMADEWELDGLLIESVVYCPESGRWLEAHGERYSSYLPTHWMPLPKAPKDEKNA